MEANPTNTDEADRSDVRPANDLALTLGGCTDLAFLGGPSSVSYARPHYTWPVVDDELIEAITRQLRTSISDRDRKGIMGEFEDAFAAFVGSRYAVSFTSGTAAIHAMCVAADFGPGDDILAPAYTFFATASPFVYEGVRTILCDSDASGNVSVAELERRRTDATRGVIVTHMWGIPCDMTAIGEFCKRHNLILFEDCSHAHFATSKGRRVGSLGDIAAFSLNQKAITAGEGGVLVTNNEVFRDRALLLGHYNKRCLSEIAPTRTYYDFAFTGFGLKYRPQPLALAIALTQLRKADQIEQRRRRNLARLIAAIAGFEDVILPVVADTESEHGLYVLAFRLRSGTGVTRDQFVDLLHAEGASEFDIPNSTRLLHRLPLFLPSSQASELFPNASTFTASIFKCPLWGYAGDDEIVGQYANALTKVAAAVSGIERSA